MVPAVLLLSLLILGRCACCPIGEQAAEVGLASSLHTARSMLVSFVLHKITRAAPCTSAQQQCYVVPDMCLSASPKVAAIVLYTAAYLGSGSSR